MTGEENFIEPRHSMAAPVIFFIILTFHLLAKFFDEAKRKGGASDKEVQLKGEIKLLLKEASTMSQPSTFAQAAKLRRVAAAKEKELIAYQESQNKENKLSFDMALKILLLVKVFTYFALIMLYWRAPVTSISPHFVRPIAILFQRSKNPLSNNVMVGIIPWIILSTRVSRYFAGLIKFKI